MSRLCLVAVVSAVASGPVVAQVPPDLATFAHVKVAKLWAGPVGEQLRAAKVPEVERALAEFAAATGLTPADVTSASVYWPDLRKADGPGVEPFVLTLTLTKPIDAGRVVAVASLGCRASGGRVSHTFEKGVLTLSHSPYYPEPGVPVRKFQEIVLDLSDATHPRLAVHVPAPPSAAKTTGPLTPALVAAAGDFAVGVNTAGLPWRWRAEGVVPDAGTRPILPELADGLWSVAGKVTADALTVEARFRGGDAAAAPVREKALRASRALLSTRLGDSHARASRPTDPKGDPTPPVPEVVAVLAGLRASLDAATTRVDGPDAVVALAVRADLPFGPALAASVAKANADAARLLATQTKLTQFALAMQNYNDSHLHFPAPAVLGKTGEPLLSWRVTVLPYVGATPLYYKFKLDEPWDSEHNAKVLKDNPMPPAFALPGVTKPGDKATHFRVFVGGGAVFEPLNPTKLAAFAGDMSHTVLVATAATAVPWTKPDELVYNPKASGADLMKLLLLAGDGCTVGMCDGTTRFVPGGIDEATLKYLITRKPAK